MQNSLHINRRQFTALTTAALTPGLTLSQTKRPELAKILVAFPAGGTTDQIARLLAEQLRGDLAETVIVENRPGAAGRIAIQGIKQANPDESTLLIHGLAIQSLYPHTVKQLGYDAFTDLAAVSTVCPLEFCLAVGPGVPESIRSLKDYANWVRQDPSRGSYATPGAGNALHFMPLIFGRIEKIELNPVHYRGTSAAMPDLIGGQIPATCTPLNDALLLGQSGKVRILATSGPKRNKFTPQVPTFTEEGYPRITYQDFFAIFLNGKTPATTQERVSAAVRKALATPQVQAGIAKLFLEPASSTPADALRIARTEHDLSGRLVKEIGYQPE